VLAVQGPPTLVVAEPSAVLGEVASLLAEGASLPEGLDALVAGLGLRGAALRTAAGDLLGSSGEVLRPADTPVLEVPVPTRIGAPATLTVTGARPSQVAALRAAAGVLGLALAPFACASLLDAADEERDGLADSLHDGPVQALVVARLAADAAVRGGDVAAARDATQAALVELRRAMWQIRPRGGEGLVDALQQLSQQRVEGGRPALELVIEPGVDLSGSRGSLAYRMVQVATTDGDRVAIRRDGPWATVDIAPDGTLPTPELWAARARALGGDLYATAGRIRLVLPLTMPRTAP
jgi:signal transduction histidine kinase